MPQTASVSKTVARSCAVLAALSALLFGVTYGTYAAADTDPYGYVSEADLIASGSLRIDQRSVKSFAIPNAASAFVPPGYTLAADTDFAVPVYAVGLPLVMGILQRVSGQRGVVFYVVPVLGALAVLLTYILGSRWDRPRTGAVAAILLAASPIVLYQIVQPVSDVPAMAWWAAALALLTFERPGASLVSGLAASMAVMTRPHLVPLDGAIGAWLIASAVGAADADEKRRARRRVGLFALGSVPGCLAVAAVNAYLFGSPLQSGYGSFDHLFGWRHVLPNLDRYPRWLVEAHSPFIALALLTPFVVRRTGAPARGPSVPFVWLLAAFTAGVFVVNSFYLAFGHDEWGYVRYMLPAVPPVLVLSAAVAGRLLEWLAGARGQRAGVLLALLTATLSVWQYREAGYRGATLIRLSERRYVDVGLYVSSGMPEKGVYITGLHSGSIRYYSGRLTLNYGRLDETALDTAIEALRAAGHDVYIALDEGERAAFMQRFSRTSSIAALDWPPHVRTFREPVVSVWDPRDRARFLAGEPVVTGDIHLVGKPVVTER